MGVATAGRRPAAGGGAQMVNDPMWTYNLRGTRSPATTSSAGGTSPGANQAAPPFSCKCLHSFMVIL